MYRHSKLAHRWAFATKVPSFCSDLFQIVKICQIKGKLILRTLLGTSMNRVGSTMLTDPTLMLPWLFLLKPEFFEVPY